MIDTPAEWVEMAWAARNAGHTSISAARRAWFEGVKCLLLESDLPKTITFPPTNITRLPVRSRG